MLRGVALRERDAADRLDVRDAVGAAAPDDPERELADRLERVVAAAPDRGAAERLEPDRDADAGAVDPFAVDRAVPPALLLPRLVADRPVDRAREGAGVRVAMTVEASR